MSISMANVVTILLWVPIGWPRITVPSISRLSTELGIRGTLSHHQCYSRNDCADVMSAISYGIFRTVRHSFNPFRQCTPQPGHLGAVC